MNLKLFRVYRSPEYTFGLLLIMAGNLIVERFPTLELPWRHNSPFVSCIPADTYFVEKRWSETHGDHFILRNVADRTYILIHVANFLRELKGCIAVGMSSADIDKDGQMDVTNSRKAMKKLLSLLPDVFTLQIENV